MSKWGPFRGAPLTDKKPATRHILVGLLLACGVAACAGNRGSAPRLVRLGADDAAVIHADEYGIGADAIVLAHGGQFNKASWRDQAMYLASEGFRVLAIDFRGYGESAGPGDADVLSAPLHLDVLAAASYLKRTGASRVFGVGASLGGWAVARVAADNPGLFSRVVFLGSTPTVPPAQLTLPKLYIMSRNDTSGAGRRLPGLEAHVAAAPEPKRLLILDGDAHAQHLFNTPDARRVMVEIVRFLKMP